MKIVYYFNTVRWHKFGDLQAPNCSMRLVLRMFVFEAASGGHDLPYEVGVHVHERVHAWLVPVGAAVPPAYDADLVGLQKRFGIINPSQHPLCQINRFVLHEVIILK